MAKVAIISIYLVGIDLTYTNRNGFVFSAISCMITPMRHVREGAGNYCCNECVFLDFDTLNIYIFLIWNLYVLFAKFFYSKFT